MNDKTWYDEVKESFLLNIEDNYTLNLAFGLLEERKELLSDNLKLKEQLQQKEDIINKAREYIKNHKRNLIHEITHEEYEMLDDENIINLLEILDNTGDENDG